MEFLSSGTIQYITQTVLHTTIIAVVIEAILGIYHFRRSFHQIRFRFLALLLPVLYQPFFFLLSPSRFGEDFHLNVALFDSNRWLILKLGGGILLGYLFLGILAATALFFLFKEAAPFVKFYFGERPSLHRLSPGENVRLEKVIARLTDEKGLPQPLVLFSADNEPVIHTSGLRTLVISASLIDLLDDDELEGVVAHELAHFTGGVAGINQASLALRFLMFYNPVALLVFRRIISDLEKRCDEIAVAATRKPLPFASGLLKVIQYSPPAETQELAQSLPTNNLKDRARGELLKERVNLALHPEEERNMPNYIFRMVATAVSLGALLFFVV